MEAGSRTISKLLGIEPEVIDEEEDDEPEEEVLSTSNHRVQTPPSEFKNYTSAEIASLERCLKLLKEGGTNDPKLDAVLRYLLGNHEGSVAWANFGGILFSQYYDAV